MDRIRDNAPPLTSSGHQDMRTDTTSTTEDARTIYAQQTTSPADLQSIEAQEPRKEGRKRRKDNTSAAAHNRYISKAYDRLILQVKAGDKEKIQAYAAEHGMTLNALLIEAVNAYCGDIIKPLAKNPYI